MALTSIERESGSAWGARFEGAEVSELDAHETLAELIAEWLAESDEQKLYLDDAPDAVLDELVGELFGGVGPFTPSGELRFASDVPARLRPIIAAISEGSPVEWTEIGGQQAIRVTRDGVAMLAVLSPNERDAIDAALEAATEREVVGSE